MAQRNLNFTPESWGDYTYWISQDKKTLKKINKLIADILRSPFEGLGKPEPLKESHSKKITQDFGQGVSMIRTGLFTQLVITL